MKNIKIQIIGESGSGKSTINTLILNMLLENGFDVKFNETLEQDELLLKTLKLRNNYLIDLEVISANRNLKDEWIDRGILESALDEDELNKKIYTEQPY